jgi:hypothetical protein
MLYLELVRQKLRWLWRKVLQDRSLLKAKAVEDLPDHLERGIVYIVGEGEYSWFAAMICPCGCGATSSYEPYVSQQASLEGYRA